MYRSAEKMGSPLLRCPPRVPYLPGTRLHLRTGFVMSDFQLHGPTLDPTHLRTSHLDRLLTCRECKSTFCFEAASVRSTMADRYAPSNTPITQGRRDRVAQVLDFHKGLLHSLLKMVPTMNRLVRRLKLSTVPMAASDFQRNHGSSQKKPHTGPRARCAQSDFDRQKELYSSLARQLEAV